MLKERDSNIGRGVSYPYWKISLLLCSAVGLNVDHRLQSLSGFIISRKKPTPVLLRPPPTPTNSCVTELLSHRLESSPIVWDVVWFLCRFSISIFHPKLSSNFTVYAHVLMDSPTRKAFIDLIYAYATLKMSKHAFVLPLTTVCEKIYMN